MSFSEEMSISGVTHNITIRLTMQLELSYLKRIKWFDNSQVKLSTIFRRFLLFYRISFSLFSEDYASFR